MTLPSTCAPLASVALIVMFALGSAPGVAAKLAKRKLRVISLVGRLISGMVGIDCSKIIDTAGESANPPTIGASPAACIAASKSERSEGRNVLRPGSANSRRQNDGVVELLRDQLVARVSCLGRQRLQRGGDLFRIDVALHGTSTNPGGSARIAVVNTT
jgi:hypothetical protein